MNSYQKKSNEEQKNEHISNMFYTIFLPEAPGPEGSIKFDLSGVMVPEVAKGWAGLARDHNSS